MGFENPIDYQHALDFGINTNTEFIAFRQKVHQSGFENFSDYKEALDLEITNFDDLKFYRDGGFKDKEQFKLAQRFRLDSLDELKEFSGETNEFAGICVSASPETIPGSVLHLFGKERFKVASKLRPTGRSMTSGRQTRPRRSSW